jgi:hypothetical protein
LAFQQYEIITSPRAQLAYAEGEKMNRLILFLLIIAAAAAARANADEYPNDVQLGQPAYGGTGCPNGTASAVLSPDNKELSILFDQYQVEAGGSTGRTLDRKACNIAIPVHIPQGWSLSIYAIDYRGFNGLPAGAYTQFNVEYFFAGQQGPRYSKVFTGPLQDDYLLDNTLAASAIVWSACGTDVILRSNSNILTRTNAAQQETLATVDSVDIKAGILYQFQWRRCGS